MGPKCNLIIDSCCDLPFDLVDREGIELLEFPYIMEDGEHSDDLYRSGSAAAFFQAMRGGVQPSTAQLSIPRIRESFMRVAESGVPAVYIGFSGELSGSFDAAQMVHSQIMEEYPKTELYLVDSKLASIAEGMVVYEAIRQRDRGLTAAELAEWATEALCYVNCQFMVDDLETLRRVGRIPSSVAYAGSKLDVKPLLTIDLEGKLALVGVARGRRKGIKQLAAYYEKRAVTTAPGQCVILGHADCPKDVERLKEALSKSDDNILFLEGSIGPVIGSHVGPGTLAVVFWGPDRRDTISVADMIARKVKGEDHS
ncbi:MAG: DegV family protein [Coriobacteriaceae bacterium]|nr:DegV family protein [Coriobacteriaceae bacterium]